MTKAEFTAAVAAKTNGTQKEAEAYVNAVLEQIGDTLAAGDKIQFVGFGTFEVKERAARSGRNPTTGEVIEIAAAKTPSFKAGAKLKEKVK